MPHPASTLYVDTLPLSATTLLRRSAIPFLVKAEPLASFLYQGENYCEPLCFQSAPTGMRIWGMVLVGAWLLAAVLATLVTETILSW